MKILNIKFLILILLLSFFSITSVYAWTEPTGIPPADNVEAPVNVGPDSQSKEGALRVEDLLIVGSFLANDDARLLIQGGLVGDWLRVYGSEFDHGVLTDSNLLISGGGVSVGNEAIITTGILQPGELVTTKTIATNGYEPDSGIGVYSKGSDYGVFGAFTEDPTHYGYLGGATNGVFGTGPQGVFATSDNPAIYGGIALTGAQAGVFGVSNKYGGFFSASGAAANGVRGTVSGLDSVGGSFESAGDNGIGVFGRGFNGANSIGVYGLGRLAGVWARGGVDSAYAGYFEGGQGIYVNEDGITLNPQAVLPDPVAGRIYFDSTTNNFYGHNGAGWNLLGSGDLQDVTDSGNITTNKMIIDIDGDEQTEIRGELYVARELSTFDNAIIGNDLKVSGSIINGSDSSSLVLNEGPAQPVSIGSPLVVDAANGYGDLYVRDALEVDGVLYVSGGCKGHASCDEDIAEYVNAATDVEAADIVALNYQGVAVKASLENNNQIIGVISTTPAIVFPGLHSSDGYSVDTGYTKKPLALAGVVQIKVTNENGPIYAGDFLTASSIPGYAAKAIKSTTVVGKALQSFDDEQGIIKVFANLGHFAGEINNNGELKNLNFTSVQTTESMYEIFGQEKLYKSGEAEVLLDQEFTEKVDPNNYFVYITATADNKGLYVADKFEDRFIVKETSSWLGKILDSQEITFDYRVVGYIK